MSAVTERPAQTLQARAYTLYCTTPNITPDQLATKLNAERQHGDKLAVSPERAMDLVRAERRRLFPRAG